MKRWWLAIFTPLLVAACGDEGPTEVGAGLLPANAVRTFELVVEPERYLVFDTAFGLYSEPRDADFLVVASRFEDAVDARGLARFNLPRSVSIVDTLGVGRIDTVPRFVSGTIRMGVDTLRNRETVQLALYRTVEPWDPSATWQLRSEEEASLGRWTVPGGTLGALIDTATYVAGGDSLVFRVDSATLALWADTANAARGAVLVMQTPGARLRTSLPILEVQVRSGFRPDTLQTLVASAPNHTFIFTPELPTAASQPRVGGTPAWRTVFRMRERLDTLTFACPGVPNCRFRLGDANLNYAALQLQPVQSPAGFVPEGPLAVGGYLVLPTGQIPLQRSPLGDFIGSATVADTSFRSANAAPVNLAITELMRALTRDPASRPSGFLPSYIALVPGEPRNFGFGTFAPMPRLRLVVSITREMQLP